MSTTTVRGAGAGGTSQIRAGSISAVDVDGTIMTSATHEALHQLIHFLPDGPGKGFLTGAFKETLPSANPFPTSIIWWESAAKLKKIFEKLITYTGVVPTTIVYNMYDPAGALVESATDAISYSAVFETNRTRTIV